MNTDNQQELTISVELQILEVSLNFILKLIMSLILLKIIVANIYRYFLESTAFHYLSLCQERRTFHILVGLCYFAGYKCFSFWSPNSIYLRFLFINFLYNTQLYFKTYPYVLGLCSLSLGHILQNLLLYFVLLTLNFRL